MKEMMLKGGAWSRSALGLLGVVLLSLSVVMAKERELPHIVVILVDDLGHGDPGCFNPDSKIPTPHMNRLAAQGMRFTDAHAPGPLCHASRYGLMTGRYPFRTDVSRWPKEPLIDEDQMTIASMLSGVGYKTTMVGKWHLGFREKGYDKVLPGGPADRGFDRFFGMRASTDIPPYFYIEGDRAVREPTETIAANASDGWSPIQGEFWRKGRIAKGLSLAEVLPRFTDEAVKVIGEHGGRKHGGDPLFLYLAYTGPHTPWLPSEDFVGKSGAGMYGDFTMMVDAEIGRVLEALAHAGMKDDTLVVLTSDNGPVWYERDVERFGHDSVGGLRGMKGDAWEGGHRMPFIVSWPGHVTAASTSDQLICFTDLMATFAEICEVDLPHHAAPDSFSFLSVLKGEQPAGQAVRGPVVMQAGNRKTMMIRSGDWKLIDAQGSGGFSKSGETGPSYPEGQLYNLRKDPAEKENLFNDKPAKVEELTKKLREIEGSRGTRPGSS